jgi:hypothetical protein
LRLPGQPRFCLPIPPGSMSVSGQEREASRSPLSQIIASSRSQGAACLIGLRRLRLRRISSFPDGLIWSSMSWTLLTSGEVTLPSDSTVTPSPVDVSGCWTKPVTVREKGGSAGRYRTISVVEHSGGVASASQGICVDCLSNLSAAPWFDRHGKKLQLSTGLLAPGAWSSPVRSNTRRARLRRSTIALPFALPVAGWALGRSELVVPTWGREETRLGLGPGSS